MPKDTQMHSAPRQRPISCKLCRSRKLRCSREAPCSNCVSRGVRCELEPQASPSISTTTSESDLVERIRKLEQIVESQQLRLTSTTQNLDREQATAQESLDTITPVSQLHRSALFPESDHLDKDVAWLESIYSGFDLLQDKIPTNKIVFRSCPIQHITSAQPYLPPTAFDYSTRFEPTRCVWLPQYAEAKVLIEKYVQNIDHVHHVVHVPSLLSVLDEVYTCLNQQGLVKPGKIILLLGIFASCTHSWVQTDCEERDPLFATPTEANLQAPLWVKALEDVLDIAHRTTKVSLEGVQGIIITFFVMVNFEGFSRRSRAIYYSALLLARELGLHCLDHPANATQANTAQTEMGRRAWWYIVASDWLVSLVPCGPGIEETESDLQLPRGFAARFDGVARGVYQCHLRQMATKKPLNIDDEDIVDGMSLVERPLSRPTSISYSLQRIRLAEISRMIVDRTPLVMGQEGGFSSGPSHDVVMDIDTELQSLINDQIPHFFSMSVATLIETYNLDPLKARHIAQQGFMFKSLVYAQRCKLHFPFYSRGFTDPTYAASRDICLRSARFIIQTESNLEYSGLRYMIRYKFIGLLMSVFMASLVLLMDLCHNRSSPYREQQRDEITAAVKILEEARHESEIAAKFLDSLILVLKKHKVAPTTQPSEQLPTPSISVGETPALFNAAGQPYSECPTVSTSTCVLGNNEPSRIDTTMSGDAFTDGGDLSSYFSDLAQGVDASTYDWDSIFSGLNSSFI